MNQSVCSIFNEVLGPVMHGPSSSHTAAPCRIGNICSMLYGAHLKSAKVCFDPVSSYASTYKFHCTDRGFTAGLLGIPVNDRRNLNAFEIARERNISITFHVEPQENKHPNYACIKMDGDNGHLEIETLSTGGGAFEIISVDGFAVSILGDSWFTLIKNPVYTPNEAHIHYVTSGTDQLCIIQTYTAPCSNIPDGERIYCCAPVLPVPQLEHYELPFSDYKSALCYSGRNHLTCGELGLHYEIARSGKTEEEVLKMMYDIMDVMRQSVSDSLSRPEGSKMSGYYPYQTPHVQKTLSELPSCIESTAKIGLRAASVFEHTLSRELVVASPTGGSCGVLPAAVVCLGDDMGLSQKQIAMGMFAAGCVGVFISNQATFGCELAGCQAENGAASAMAAAGVADMLRCDAKTAFDAASLALQNTLGLICDPVACAYVPCVTRNSMAAVNAVSAASLACGGYIVYIPLDETIDTMMQVGQEMPLCHRCTGGGLNNTPSGQKLNKINSDYLNSL